MEIEYLRANGLAPLPMSHYLICKARKMLEPAWFRLGALETRLLRSRLAQSPVDRPIYVTGLARAGTTIALTLLHRHPDVASHCYRDMPQPYLPYLWNRLVDRLPLPFDAPTERVHKDGMMVNRDSPEAVEEALWEKFFPWLHDETRSAVLDGHVSHPAFEAYYRSTIGKLLLVRSRTRYLSKANYNLTRLGYLARIMPGARFVVMTRSPESHFASWIKQHEIFLKTQESNPRWKELIRMVGHCEFGHGNRFVNAGDDAVTAGIRRAWDAGERARAFGMYWSAMYGHALALADSDRQVRDALLFVRYEDLCAAPAATIGRILEHVRLDPRHESLIVDTARVEAPAYYRATLTSEETAAIHAATASIAARLGYAGR